MRLNPISLALPFPFRSPWRGRPIQRGKTVRRVGLDMARLLACLRFDNLDDPDGGEILTVSYLDLTCFLRKTYFLSIPGGIGVTFLLPLPLASLADDLNDNLL